MDLERLIDFDTAKKMLDHVGWQVPGIDPLPKNSFPAEEMAAHAARDSACSFTSWLGLRQSWPSLFSRFP